LVALKVKGRYVLAVGEVKEGFFVGEDVGGRPLRMKVKGLIDFGPVRSKASISPHDGLDLRELWDLGEELDLDTAAELLLGSNSPGDKASIFLSALRSPFFKVEGERLIPRSEDDVRSILARERAEREEEEMRAELARTLKGEETPIVPILRAIYRGEREDRRLLRLISSHEDFWRAFLNAGHVRPEDVPAHINALKTMNTGGYEGLELEYEDLRDLPTFSIDDEETRDIDDAISVVPTASGYELFIHIALPYALVRRGSEADLLARGRGSTLYLPEGIWPMYPQEAVEALSLKEGEERPTLTLRLVVTPYGEVRDYDFMLATIRNKRRLAYRNAERILREEGLWEGLMHLKENLRAGRLKAGGMAYDHPFLKVKFHDGSITVSLLTPNDATALVGEMMILYNSVAGAHLARRGLVGIFRIQEEPPPTPHPLPGDPLYLLKLKAAGRPVRTSIKPGPHRGLGVPYYVRATSPIRRYSDVINQHQILASLRVLPPLPPDVVERDMGEALAGELKRHKAQRERTTFLLLHHLRLSGEVEGVASGKRKVFLPGYLMEVRAKGSLRYGGRYRFRVVKVLFGDGTAVLEPIESLDADHPSLPLV